MENKWSEFLSDEHIGIVCRALGIGPEGIDRVYGNPGRSANNKNYVVVAGGRSYLYRVPGAGTDIFCDRKTEGDAYELLAPYHLTDEVVYFDKQTGAKLSVYYENSRIPLADSQQELDATMATLRRLHALPVTLPVTDPLFARVDRYIALAKKAGGEDAFLPGFGEYCSITEEFRAWVEARKPSFCLTHGDVSINNVLVTKQYPYPILIDMEFPAMGDPIGDVGTYCVDAGYLQADILKTIDSYLGREATPAEQYKALGMSAVAGMMWYGWAAYKIAVEDEKQQYIDFRNDYHLYVAQVFASAQRLKRELGVE